MAQFDINVTEFDVFWSHFMMGLGQSVAFTPMTLMAFATLPRHHLTEGAAVFTMMRNFGSSLFISMAVLVLVRSTASNYGRMTEFITPYRREPWIPGLPEVWNVETATGLMRLSNEIHRQAAMIGYVNAFYMMGVTALAALPLACLLRRGQHA
jgi:DHA2 family multidrug resistance protein